MFTFLFVFSTFNGILPQLSNTTDIRQRRDLSGLQTATDHLQSAARISNAIYLHQGFRKGSINPANFGAEILRLGSNSLSQIDEAGLNSGVQALHDLPSKIQGNAEVKKFEEYYGNVEDVLKPLEGVASLKEWSGKKDFEEDIRKMKNGSFDVKLVTDITKTAGDWQSTLNFAKNVKDQSNHPFGKGLLQQLLKFSQDLLSYVNSPPQLPNVFQFKGHQTASSSFAVLPRTAHSFKALLKAIAISIKGDPKKKMKENLDGLSDSATKIGTFKTSFIAVKEVLDSRARPLYSPQYKLTAGFSGGQKDVDFVFKDLTMPWIQKISDSSKLSSALEPLKGIGANSDSLQKLDGNYIENSDVVNQVISLSETFLTAAANPTKFMDTSEALFKCVEKRGATDTVPPIDTLEKLVESLDEGLGTVNAKISSIGSNLKNQDLKDLLQKTVKIVEGYESKDAAVLQKVFDDLNNQLQNTDPIDGIKDDIKLLVKPLTVKSGDVEKEFPSIEDFLTSTAPYDVFLQCLRKVTDRDAFFSSIKTLKDLRESNGKQEHADLITKSSDIAKAVISAKKDLKTIGDVASSVKSSKKPDSLSVFTDMSKHSEMIGGAARGVLSMRKLIEKKTDLQFVVDHLDLVKKELAVVSTAKRVKRDVSSNDQTLLNDLLAIDGPVQAMITSLAQLESSATAPTANNLAGLSSIFKSAQQVQGIDKDLVGMAEAVGRLAKTVQDPNTKSTLVKMASTLAALGSLGLDFSKHAQEFQGCPSSLKQLDVLFAKQKSNPASNNSSGSSPSGNNGPNGPTGNGTNAAASPLASLISSTVSSILEATTLGFVERNKALIIIGSLVGAGLALAGYLVYHFCFKKKKVEETKPVDPPTPTPVNEANVENGDQKVNPPKPEDDKEKGKTEEEKGKSKPEVEKEKPKPEEVIKYVPVPVPVPEVVKEIVYVERQAPDAPRPEPLPENFSAVAILWVINFHQQIRNYRPHLEAHSTIRAKNTYEVNFYYLIAIFDSLAPELNNKDAILLENLKEFRHYVSFNKETRVVVVNFQGRFISDFIHWNKVPLRNGHTFYLGQGPQVACKEVVTLPDKTVQVVMKIETIVKTWVGIRQESIENIAMLCQFIENGDEKCSVYFPEEVGKMELDRLVIKCVDKTLLFDGLLIVRKLTYQFDGEAEVEVRHLQYVGWPDKDVPPNGQVISSMLHMLRRTGNGKTFVHCSAGIGRSGTFAYIEKLYQAVGYKGECLISKEFRDLRAERGGAVQTPLQFAFAVVSAIDMVLEGADRSKFTEEQRKSIEFFPEAYVVFGRMLRARSAAKAEEDKEKRDKKKGKGKAAKNKKEATVEELLPEKTQSDANVATAKDPDELTLAVTQAESEANLVAPKVDGSKMSKRSKRDAKSKETKKSKKVAKKKAANKKKKKKSSETVVEESEAQKKK